MKTIKEDIKSGNYRRAYLLYGSEGYLKRRYRDRLKEGVLAGGDEINFSYFEGKGIDGTEVAHIGQTLPFFAEKRLILIENHVRRPGVLGIGVYRHERYGGRGRMTARVDSFGLL